MKEAVILQSPHAVDPMETLTEKEKAERYRTRLDETFRPYTVIDVLTKVYHRRFEDDLRQSVGERPEDFLEPENGWRVSRVWVNGCRIVRVETLFFQPLSDFQVDLFARVSLRMELVRGGDTGMTRYKSLRTELRLRYSLNLRPCKLTCRFVKTVVKEEDGLLARNPMAIRADKYLLPILHESDYPRLARWILSQYDMTENGLPLDVDLLAMRMGLKLLPGRFSEKGVTGEIYFNHGRAEILDPATGEARDTNIDPGTIILNLAACTTRGIDLQHSVKSGYRRKGLWIMNDATLKLLRKLKDGQGNFIWQLGLLAGQPDTLLNQKVMISNYMPLPAAGNKAILYGDLSYYWLADREGRALQRLDELYAAQDQVGFKITQRVDGRLLLRESVKCLQMKAA